jgi:ATP-dependent 26S proteasome regulatory subunit
MASNYPDDLDFALVRPGRIDMKIEFGSCTMEQLVDMCTNFMGEEKAKLCIEDVDTRKFEAKQFSVADIISNVVLPYHDDVK